MARLPPGTAYGSFLGDNDKHLLPNNISLITCLLSILNVTLFFSLFECCFYCMPRIRLFIEDYLVWSLLTMH